MVCSICGQDRHNRRTCPVPVPPANPNPTNASASTLQAQAAAEAARAEAEAASRRARRRWRKIYRAIRCMQRFINYSYDRIGPPPPSPDGEWTGFVSIEDIRIIYPTWLKMRKIMANDEWFTPKVIEMLWKGPAAAHQTNNLINTLYANIQVVRNRCFILYRTLHPEDLATTTQNTIVFHNLRPSNYLIYWVIGNNLQEELDALENPLIYICLLSKMGTSKRIITEIGHRFYVIPHRLDMEPPYHPLTDKQFLVEPYCQIDVHEGTGSRVIIDDKDQLSPVNHWKFKALKLDYLIKEVIKLGGKEHELFGSILDLHEDIKLNDVSNIEKEAAGIPSILTNAPPAPL